LLMFSIVIFSCDDSELDVYKEVAQPTRIGFESPMVDINVQGDETYNIVAIMGAYDEWGLTASEPWINVDKGTTEENGKKENTVVVSATPNTGYSRSGKVTVTASDGDKTVSKSFEVSQETALEEPSLEISTNLLNFIADGGTETIQVETNQSEWTVSTVADWITLEQEGTNLSITTTANSGADARE